MTKTSLIHATWAIVARRNGLSKKQAKRLFPKVLAYALDHFEVVRRAVRQELAAAVERITATAVILRDIEVATIVADFATGLD
jgi:hypothetical protein